LLSFLKVKVKVKYKGVLSLLYSKLRSENFIAKKIDQLGTMRLVIKVVVNKYRASSYDNAASVKRTALRKKSIQF